MVNLRDGLIGEWLLDGNARDTSGNGNHGTVTGATLTDDELNRVNRAYSFDGTNDYIQISDSSTLNTNNDAVSVECFFRVDSTSGGEQSLVDKREQSPSAGFQLRVENKAIKFLVRGSAGEQNLAVNGISNTTDFVHVVATFDGGDFITYVDGESHSVSKSADLLDSDEVMRIGEITPSSISIPSSYNLDGDISLVRVWNRALSANEAKQLYTEVQPQYQALFEDCVGYWDLSNDSKELINQNDGTVTGATLTTGRLGETNGAYNFDGSGDYIDMGDVLDATGSSITLAGLVRKDDDTDNRVIVGKYWTAFELGSSGNHDKVQFTVTTSGGTTDLFGTDNTFTDSDWHLVVGVYDGSNMYIYLDGELETSTAKTGTISTNSNNLYIGARDPSNRIWNGNIAEVGIWNRALSSEEITQLYELSLTKKIYPFIRGVKD